MKSLDYEPRLLSSGLQALLAIGGGLMLARVIVNEPVPLVIAALVAVILVVFFVLRPDLGLLLTLIIRGFSDAFIGRMGSASGGGIAVRLLTSPNAGMIILVILGGALYLLTHRARILSLPGALSLLLMLLIGGIGLMVAPSITSGLDRWLADWSALVVYALVAAVFWKPQQIQRVVNVFAVAFIVPALVGLKQLVTRQGCRVDEVNLLRICGTFTHPNAFAFFLVIIVSVFLCQALVQTGGRKWLALSIVGISGILLIWTQTRSGWAGTLIVLLAVGATRNRRVLLFAPVLIAIALILVPAISSRVSDISGGLTGRQDLWRVGYNNWLWATTNPFSPFATVLERAVGTGPDSVGGLTHGWAAHNDYLLVFTEYGAIGLAAFLGMFGSLIVSAYRTWQQSRNHPMEPIALSFFALTLAYPAMHFTDNLVGRSQNQLYFWTLAGLTAAVGRMLARTEHNPSPALLGARGALSIEPPERTARGLVGRT